ncbi:MAG: DUF6259 domain-containing protein [Patescibacteria group bacterium]|nr:DUF6259 domain-containing protein [Patescibacteria group bacterium]
MISKFLKMLKYLLSICICYLTITNTSIAASETSAVIPAFVLKNDFVQLEFEKEYLGLSGMIDLKSGKNHVYSTGRPHLLWELIFRRGMQTERLTSAQYSASSYKISTLPGGTQRATIVWDGITFWREKNAIVVTVTVDLPKESGIALWKISVDNRSDFWGLWEVHFPYFSGFMKAPDYTVARPSRNWGQLYEGVTEVEVERYPSSQWPVQMMCAYTGCNGILLSAYDPESWLKSYRCEPGKVFYFTTYVRDMGVAGSDFQQDWAFAVGVYQGQWMEACKIYRTWAMTAPWMKKGKLSRRAGVPESIKNIGLWMINGWEFQGAKGTPAQMNQPLLNAQKFFNVPLGVHWYNWHQIKFDNEYPHYFPTKPGFKERVQNLKDNKILVMPYINSRLWDYDLPDYPLKWALVNRSVCIPRRKISSHKRCGLPVE